MPAQPPPPPSRSRRLGVLAVALGVGLLVVVLVTRPDGDDGQSPVDAEQDSTVPSVLGSIVERSTTLAPSDPAPPAPFVPSTPATVAPRTAQPRPSVTTLPPVTLLPPVVITSPPRTIPTTTETTETVTASSG